MKKTFFAMMAAVATSATLPAATIELLTNGDGSTLDGWQNNDFGLWENGATGENWFRASYNYCRLMQTVALTDLGITSDEIQAGITLTASVTAFATERTDNNAGSAACRVVVYEYDASGVCLATNVVLDKAGTYFDATTFTTNFALNSDTRSVKYEMDGQSIRFWAGVRTSIRRSHLGTGTTASSATSRSKRAA